MQTVTSRQRVIRALSHQPTDRIPYSYELTLPLAERLREEPGTEALLAGAGRDVLLVPGLEGGEWIKPGYFRDLFGVVWNRSGPDKDIGVVGNKLLPEADAALIKLPEVDVKTLRSNCAAAVEAARRDVRFLFIDIGFSMFERAWTLRGMEDLLADMILEPNFVHELMERICDYQLAITKIALEYDIDGIHFGDDWGQQKGLIMGPAHWHTFIRPHMARLFAAVRNAGRFVSLHSCGDISELFGPLIDIGLNCYQTFQPEIYDAAAFKREYGSHLTVWGGISTQRLLPFATPEGVRAATVDLMRTLGLSNGAGNQSLAGSPGGGLIAAPTHDMPADIPTENILAMLDVFEHQDKYL